MDLKIVEIHPAESSKALNTEWFVVENVGDSVFNTKNCTLGATRGAGKPRGSIGTLDPGFTVAPGEKVRVVTGNPGKKAHGKAPEDELQNYFLFLAGTVVRGPGTVLVFSLRSHELCRATFDPESPNGVAS
jgi:hypothetical protein